MRYIAALTTIFLTSGAVAQSNYALGPVESSNSKTEVVVLGQRFALDSNTRCKVRSKVVSRQFCVLALSRDVYAVVEGDSLKLDRAAAITVLPYSYVPGASTVMVGGRVTAVHAALGSFQFGSLLVSNTSLLARGPISLEVGQYVETVGIQPQLGDLVLANGLRFNQSSQTIEIVESQTITGTGIQTITGTGIQTITGTGIQTITGTGTQTITGTGAQTITGTGAQTITGTGAQTITGTGAQTITGTGAQTITGTGAQTITGTGALTITGTGALTITGTGAQTITGTGTQTITGTGTQTITGTGTRTITGTGR
jgi:hypothetical protein